MEYMREGREAESTYVRGGWDKEKEEKEDQTAYFMLRTGSVNTKTIRLWPQA